MAKKRGLSKTDINKSRTFLKGLTKDTDPSFIQDGMWTHARNAVNNTKEGDLGTLSNEESNFLSGVVGEDITISHNSIIVGVIPLFSGKWLIYSAIYNGSNDNVITSEIGLFEEEPSLYRPVVRDKCLNFDKFNLISGASREKEDCTWQIYWADGNNPDRYINVGDPKLWPSNDYVWLGGLDGSPTINYYSNGTDTEFLWPGVAWEENLEEALTPEPCLTFADDNKLNCDKIRLSSLVKTPCIDVTTSSQQGTIENGSYAFAIAYVINRQIVTNFFSLSYIQPIFNDTNEQGSFDLTIKADSEHFDEFVLVVARFINQGSSLKQIGYFSTKSTNITLDQISETLPNVSESSVLQQNPVFDTSKQIAEGSRYLLRIGPISKFDFNYQPLANRIKTKWVSVEYPEDYYVKGGKNAGYLRDEVYAFFIRWVYDTGDKSASYNIPGRPPRDYNGFNEKDPFIDDLNTLPGEEYLYETINTGVLTGFGNTTEPIDSFGGTIKGEGDMGYWESTEIYPDNQPEIWNSSYYCWSDPGNTNFDLCGENIRHHKFPDNSVAAQAYHFDKRDGKYFIRLMGVSFEDIILPKDNDGNDISGIVGYEILRSSRHGNKSIVAKGMVNNFRDYKLQGRTISDSTVGVYANYPFNCIRPKHNLSIPIGDDAEFFAFNDPFIVNKNPGTTFFGGDTVVNQSLPNDLISFHSPDTSFKRPFLSMSELKVYGHLEGVAEQRFIEPNGHPKFRLLANGVFIPAFIGGLINAMLQIKGEQRVKYNQNPAANITPLTSVWPAQDLPNVLGYALQNALSAAVIPSRITDKTIAGVATSIVGTSATEIAFDAGIPILNVASAGYQFIGTDVEYVKKGYGLLPIGFQAFTGVPQFLFYTVEGAKTTVELIYEIVRARQYALEQIGHGEYNQWKIPSTQWPSRFIMADGIYVFDDVQDFPEFQNFGGESVRYRINNRKRPRLTVLRTERRNGFNHGPRFIFQQDDVVSNLGLNWFNPSIDTSSMALRDTSQEGSPSYGNDRKVISFRNTIASHYAGLKFSIRNQYGQLDSIQQIVATPCEQNIDFDNLSTTISSSIEDCINPLTINKINKTPVFFGGDTYVNRFTEKNTMPFFYNWLFNVPEDTPYNYYLAPNIPYPRYWANSERWDVADSFNFSEISQLINSEQQGTGPFPSNFYNLDGSSFNLFNVKDEYFYLSVNGIRDFFVESEVLVDFRSRGTFDYEKFYDKYKFTDLELLFDMNPEIITRGNTYIYDYSLSSSRFIFNQYFTQGVLQNRTYDPTVADLCFTSYPHRINYSLPQVKEDSTDGWLTYLPLNNVTFRSNVNSVKNYGKTGLFITFEDSSPLVYAGVDERETYVGVSTTVGDGGLFAATPTSITASDKKYEYGSSQDRLGIISSPAGLYFISQQQGKIFSYGQGLTEISQINMKWWFNEFLPYKLLEDFPDFPHVDNPVAGIGCSAGYDNTDGIIYFSKKDYVVKDQYKGLLRYLDKDKFAYTSTDGVGKGFGAGKSFIVNLGDPMFFEDASWTISYDPKSKQWISFHDWHPNLYLSGRNKHYTTKVGSIWEHNAGCNNYCNFYNIQYPFEVGIPFNTGKQVATVRSLEYYLECYKRDSKFCVDQFHVLDYNFDQAIIYNSEQVSGYLNLNIYPKNNVALAQNYPKIGLDSIDILVSKEEQKYRFNQFWDITKNRGEFPDGSGYPPTGELIPNTTTLFGNYEENQIWSTQANGYIQTLNSNSINYNKNQLERKKFRHYNNFAKLIKNNPQDVNMIIKFVEMKGLYSPR